MKNHIKYLILVALTVFNTQLDFAFGQQIAVALPRIDRAGFKQGLYLESTDGSHVVVSEGAVFITPSNVNGGVVKNKSKLSITPVLPSSPGWSYVYVTKPLNGVSLVATDFFASSSPPIFIQEKVRTGFYDSIATNAARCVGVFYVKQSGSVTTIVPFRSDGIYFRFTDSQLLVFDSINSNASYPTIPFTGQNITFNLPTLLTANVSVFLTAKLKNIPGTPDFGILRTRLPGLSNVGFTIASLSTASLNAADNVSLEIPVDNQGRANLIPDSNGQLIDTAIREIGFRWGFSMGDTVG